MNKNGIFGGSERGRSDVTGVPGEQSGEGDPESDIGAVPAVLHPRMGVGDRWQHHNQGPRRVGPEAPTAGPHVPFGYRKNTYTHASN